MTADDEVPPDNEGPLSRWSRRKAEIREKQSATKQHGGAAPSLDEAPAELPARAEPDGGAVDGGAVDGGAVDGEEAAPPDLPDIDSLTAESDFTVFMRAGVPDQLRKLALRKLWRSDPVLANLDGMVDYGEDFTDAADVVKNLKTAYQVGKGYAPDEPDEPDEPEETPEAESPEGDVAESGQEDVAEAPAADQPAAGEDGVEAEDGDGQTNPEPGEREPDPAGGAG